MDIIKQSQKNTKGFTFVEIVVVIGIFAVISSVVLFNFRDFSGSVSLQNLTQQIALQVSTMQRSTLAGRQPFSLTPQNATPPTVIPSWTPSYGLCFTLNDVGCGLGSNYGPDNRISGFTLFADGNNNKDFDGGEKLDTIRIDGTDFISDICINKQTVINFTCGEDEVLIVYTRPEVSPDISYGSNNANDVTIQVETPEGATREIIVWASGQIETR